MNIAEIARHLQDTGYIVLEHALPDELLARLLARCQNDDTERFSAAHVGRGADKKQIKSLRGDAISWLDEADETDHDYLALMESLRSGLNQSLYLGLFDYECHYAIYASGAGYAKHSDVLVGKKNRILTTVLYLNEAWQAADGGELQVYDPTGDKVIATVLPKFGTMIIFLSEMFPHEVLISQRTRRSMAGWFRVSGS
jgi:SM-20-related protein